MRAIIIGLFIGAVAGFSLSVACSSVYRSFLVEAYVRGDLDVLFIGWIMGPEVILARFVICVTTFLGGSIGCLVNYIGQSKKTRIQ